MPHSKRPNPNAADPAAPAAEAETLSWVHAGRLRAAERELSGLLAQMKGILEAGGSPNEPGAPSYPPLAPETTAELSGKLAEIAGLARRVGELAGPDPASRSTRGPGATRAAFSARLARIEETLKDLYPSRLQAKYGDLPPAIAAELADLCDRMGEQVRQAREHLEARKP
jgi:hypothetical protein